MVESFKVLNVPFRIMPLVLPPSWRSQGIESVAWSETYLTFRLLSVSWLEAALVLIVAAKILMPVMLMYDFPLNSNAYVRRFASTTCPVGLSPPGVQR